MTCPVRSWVNNTSAKPAETPVRKPSVGEAGFHLQYNMCLDCLNLYVNAKLDAGISLLRLHGEDVSLWVKACNLLLEIAGFDAADACCSTCERPTSDYPVNVDSAVCMRWDFEKIPASLMRRVREGGEQNHTRRRRDNEFSSIKEIYALMHDRRCRRSSPIGVY